MSGVARARRSWLRISKLRRWLLVASTTAVAVFAYVALAGGTQPYQTYEETVAGDGPVAQFRFDDALGSSTLADSAGSYTASNTGIVLGGEGPFGGSKSGSFGGEAFATLPSDPLPTASEFTAEAWVNWTGGTTYKQPIFDFGSGSTSYMYLTPASSLLNHKMLFEIRTSASSDVQVTAMKLAASKWDYVAVTETSSGTLTLYLNSEQVGQTTGASLFPSSIGAATGDYLGKAPIIGEPLFNGSLSNVAFYNKALSEGQIRAHYNDGEYPVNTVAPTVTGTLRDGSTLTAKPGTWTGITPITYSYQWTRCNPAGEACSSIPLATEMKYILGHEDAGTTIRVAVTGSNGEGQSTTSSAATGKIEPLIPSTVTLPAISGEAKDGQLLSVSNGTWKGTPPLSYTYEWESCNSTGGVCKKITGATSSTYRVLTSEIGKTLKAIVTATNAAGSAKATTEATAVITSGPPVNTTLPAISGEAKDGQTLSASTGSWAGTPTITYAYQWKTCNTAGEECTNITGATSSTLALKPENVGSTVRVAVTGTNSVGSSTATSLQTAVVAAIPPSNTAGPAISGTDRDGQTLMATTGTWTGTPTITYTYQWESCNEKGEGCTGISGATTATYVLEHEDVGKTLLVAVTAKNAGGSASKASSATSVIEPLAPSNTVAPVISGTAEEGNTLAASTGSWEGTPPFTYSYQWEDCNSSGESCSSISGATSSSYVLANTDVGHTIRVVVTAENAGGSAPATSSATSLVTEVPPMNDEAPAISGEAEEGQLLTASQGAWEGTEPLTYSYEWEDCNALGEGCMPIDGATEASYTVASTDVGDTMRVTVTATNSAGTASQASGVTAVVVSSSSCTDTWVGEPGEHSWETPGNWSAGHVPTSSDVVCVPSEAEVEIVGGENAAASITDEGTLTISGGSLELARASAESNLGTLNISNGNLDVAGELSVSGSLVVSGGSVELTNAPGESTVQTLNISNGNLDIAGKLSVSTALVGGSTTSIAGQLDVSASLATSGEATITGAGEFVVESDATGTIGGSCSTLTLDETELVNEGVLSADEGTIAMRDGARLENEALFKDDSSGCSVGESGYSFSNGGGATPSIVNTGTFAAHSGSATSEVGVKFDNAGTVEVKGGLALTEGGEGTDAEWSVSAGATLAFAGGSFALDGGEWWGYGTFEVGEAEVTATGLDSGGEESLTVGPGSLGLTPSGAFSVHGLTLNGGTLSASEELNVSSSLATTGEATLAGNTQLNVGEDATGTIDAECSTLTLEGGRLVNNGELTMNSGSIAMEDSAQLENPGIFHDNDSECGGTSISDGGGTPSILSTGIFEVLVRSGGADIVGVKPDATVGGPPVVRIGVNFALQSGELVIGEEDQFEMLATLAVTGAPTINGFGELVIASGKTAVFGDGECSTHAALRGVTVSNHGTILLGATGGAPDGAIAMSLGAKIHNAENGTFYDDSYEAACGFAPAGYSLYHSGGRAPSIVNDGSFVVDVTGAATNIGVNFDNDGAVEAQSGRLELSGGGLPENIGEEELDEQVTTGSWSAPAGQIALTGGEFLFAKEVDLSAVQEEGAVVEQEVWSHEPPEIEGEAAEGQTLTANSESTGTYAPSLRSPGGFTGQPATLSYQWEECDGDEEGERLGEACVVLEDATNPTYTLEAEEDGYTMRVTVTATNALGSTSSTSAATPVISGTEEEVEEGGEEEGEPDEFEERPPETEPAEGVVINDEEEGIDESPDFASKLGVRPEFTTKTRDIIDGEGTFRNDVGALVIGTAQPGRKFDSKIANEAKGHHWQFGMLYKNVEGCGWVPEHSIASKPKLNEVKGKCPSVHHLIWGVSFASLVNCDKCNAGTPTHIVAEGMEKIPVFANVKPYGEEKGLEPFTTLNTMRRNEHGELEPEKLGWRYITKGGKFASITINQRDKWYFIERKYLPSDEELCKHQEPHLPPKNSLHGEEAGQEHWPKVCEEGEPVGG